MTAISGIGITRRPYLHGTLTSVEEVFLGLSRQEPNNFATGQAGAKRDEGAKCGST